MEISGKCVYEVYALLNKEIYQIKNTKSRGSHMQSNLMTLIKHRNTLRYYLLKNKYLAKTGKNATEYRRLKSEIGKEEEDNKKKEKMSNGEMLEKRDYHRKMWKKYCDMINEQSPDMRDLIL